MPFDHLFQMPHVKNFLTGPTQVHLDVLAQLSRPVIGHHTNEFRDLLKRVNPRLQRLLGTEYPVFCLTSTASAGMEAALTNSAGEKTLILANGAFGERWLTAARGLDLPADGLSLSWGVGFDEHEIGRLLDRVGYDTLVVVHGETSTGVLNPIRPIAGILERRPQVLFILDAVATLGGVPVAMDDSRVDILLGASQKCLALPPGLVPIGVSPRALERSLSSKRKGYALDFIRWLERWEKFETVATPAISLFYALDYQLKRIESETLERRFQRHENMAQMTLAWAEGHYLIPVAPEGRRLPSTSCLRFESDRSTTPVVDALLERGYQIDDGYGKLKGQTLRIGHLGDWTEDDLDGLLAALGEILSRE